MKTALALFIILSSTFCFATTIIDVRTPEEYQGCHLKGTKNINVLADDFKTKVSKLNKNHAYQLHCRTGNRSGKAIEIMKGLGFKKLENLGSLAEAQTKTNGHYEGKDCPK